MSTFVLWLNSTYSVYFVVSQQGAIMKSLMQWNHLPAAADEWIDRIEALAPLILQHRDHAEEHGATHPDVMARAPGLWGSPTGHTCHLADTATLGVL
jgi:hypothetical protein